MKHLVVTIDVRAERVEDFLSLVASHQRLSLEESGCLQFDVCGSGFVFMLYEVWESEADLALHRQSPHYARWRELMPDIESRPRVREEYETVRVG